MEHKQSCDSCLITWRGQDFVIEMNPGSTFGDLGKKLQDITDAKADTIRLLVPMEKTAKLIYPFSDQHAGLSLDSTTILKGKRVRMMGVPNKEVDEVIQQSNVDHRIPGFMEEERRLKQRVSASSSYSSIKLPKGTYVFCDFRTLNLPGRELSPPPSKALGLLHKLASDPGIVAIMNKHRWRVGILTEMAPVGYVGVSPKCILGFNKNFGEEISLRLRTDDLKGFRKYDSIKKTLLHELAHMVFSEHDSNFYALDRQLNREAVALDWTKSQGHTVSRSSHAENHEEEDEEFGIDSSSSVTTNSSHKLGGKTSRFSNPRFASENAALRRSEILSLPSPSPSSSSERWTLEPKNAAPVEDSAGIEKLDSSEAGRFFSAADAMQESRTYPSEGNSNEPTAASSVLSSGHTDDGELQIIQDPVAIFYGCLQRLIQALKNELQQQQQPSETEQVLQTLNKIIRNVLENPGEMKFKKLRKGNPVMRTNIMPYKAAVEILKLIGFCDEEWGKSESFLTLKRNDPGILWLAKSSLEEHMP